MPTYGYECLACHNQIEVFQSIKDAPLTTCEICSGTLRKRIYPVGIAFKGSGFYVNDYAAKPASSGASGSETKSEPGSTEAPKAEAPQIDVPKVDAPKAETPKTEAKKEATPAL